MRVVGLVVKKKKKNPVSKTKKSVGTVTADKGGGSADEA